MLEDCEAGNIDIILTKSISRFARNTVDLLETVRCLKELGISVRFEKENIDSLSGNGEVMLTLLASFAQEEITSLSNNVKWGIRKRFEKGIPNFRNKILGYEWEDDHLVVVPEEAAIVKRIFQNFLDGKSRLETERELNGEGITKKKDGRCPVKGGIRDDKLRMTCADALGLDEFDETTFLAQVDHIEVPKRYQIEIHLKDGRVIPKDCTPTGHQDCWTQAAGQTEEIQG